MCIAGALGCDSKDVALRRAPAAEAEVASSPRPTVASPGAVTAPLEAAALADSPRQARAGASPSVCPADMIFVSGDYCPKLSQTCIEWHRGESGRPAASERCLRFAEPSLCEGDRVTLSFCIDRFEWPNAGGEKPHVLVSWHDASAACQNAGKRLCSESEWTFACEGEKGLPYPTGYTRPRETCAIDFPYRIPRARLSSHRECLLDARCRAELERLDQRRPIREDGACRSPFGVLDMVGNVNEWVDAEGGKYPHRGALKGGWWGPVRNRCRPAVHRHREDHWGYEIGFRCCRNLDDTSGAPK